MLSFIIQTRKRYIMLEMSYILYWHGCDFGQYFLPILVLQYLSKKFLIVNQHLGGQSSSYNRKKQQSSQ